MDGRVIVRHYEIRSLAVDAFVQISTRHIAGIHEGSVVGSAQTAHQVWNLSRQVFRYDSTIVGAQMQPVSTLISGTNAQIVNLKVSASSFELAYSSGDLYLGFEHFVEVMDLFGATIV